jgi:hypothetical protein
MAADGLILASTKLENFSPETIDMNSIKLLNNQGHLVYDGTVSNGQTTSVR